MTQGAPKSEESLLKETILRTWCQAVDTRVHNLQQVALRSRQPQHMQMANKTIKEVQATQKEDAGSERFG